MIDRVRLLRLRLAARTLIEWKVPVSTEKYQKVLSDLLSIHPYAYNWGLRLDSTIFDMDYTGTMLWHLSETLDSPVPKLERWTADRRNVVTKDVIEKSLRRMTEYAIESRPGELAWPGGPTKRTVADMAFRAISIGERIIVRSGWETLLVMLLGPDLLQQSIRRLMAWERFLIGEVDTTGRITGVLMDKVGRILSWRHMRAFSTTVMFHMSEKIYYKRLRTLVSRSYGPISLLSVQDYLHSIFLLQADIFKACINTEELCYFALFLTPTISSEGALAVLTSLKSSELPAALRDVYFMWLCKVQVLES